MSRPVLSIPLNYPSKTTLNSFKFSGVPIRVFTKRGHFNPSTVMRTVIAKALKMIYSRLIQRSDRGETYRHGNDQGCYAFISDWLVECASRHPHFRAPKHLALPSRLLDVGGQGTNSIFRSVSSEGLAGNYLALSYCWGSADSHSPKLLNSNVLMYEVGVPSSFLPRIFQGAFQISRGLGCRCIWVDALCIIQDSDSDKASEIAKMKDVFQNSYLQEPLLPCCILHYTSDQLAWEC
jgi:hypothetical protein